ncbi:iron complex transport system substrate-binding protein [Pseudoduganella flava]|uniref:ABC transporter substrate-binding protein n=1 Tax=Pseudoduganella flava TaxID=871742 RepID=A0A562P6Q2_9BURK|nr:cobalamin-binding protein [Pseudoduganella flava]QGZ41082.1 ABC transporter substrate-binding protein [Pseudoduganella flava]TWI40147.1 iron complex transport system substrate-binding protein [Pseudoduganella flava]
MKKLILLPALCAVLTAHGAAAVSVRDDDGQLVTLPKPAQRVISMAPHVTELLFAAGAGGKIVGAVDYSDYPEAAKAIPRVGSNREVDLERVLALKPDLIVVWRHGSSERQIDMLRKLGIPLFHSEPTKLDAIPDSVIAMGKLAGTEPAAEATAADLRRRLAALRAKYGSRPVVRTFYQVWDKPLYTLNGAHIVSDALRLCGGENIFASQKVTAPVVSYEAVLQEDPEAVFSTAEKDQGGANLWRKYPTLKATKLDNLFTIDGNLVNRAGPRMIAGTEALCEKLEIARQHRKN